MHEEASAVRAAEPTNDVGENDGGDSEADR